MVHPLGPLSCSKPYKSVPICEHSCAFFNLWQACILLLSRKSSIKPNTNNQQNSRQKPSRPTRGFVRLKVEALSPDTVRPAVTVTGSRLHFQSNAIILRGASPTRSHRFGRKHTKHLPNGRSHGKSWNSKRGISTYIYTITQITPNV